jgi:ribosomal protein S18 acetylase RimI-like enzyme
MAIATDTAKITIVPSAAHLRLRSASEDDEPFLRGLFDATRSQLAQAGLPVPMLEMLLAQQFQLQRSSYKTRYPDAVSLIMTNGECLIGRLLLWCGDQSWHIVDIAVLPHHRRQGAGTAVMQGVETAARGRNVAALTLAVMAENLDARRFYAGLGFIEPPAAASAYLALVKRLDD